MKLSKATMEYRHAMQRLWERFEIVYSKEVRDDLLGAIRDRRTRIVEKQSNRVTIHEYEYQGNVLWMAYDRKRKEIITFLYPESMDQESEFV